MTLKSTLSLKELFAHNKEAINYLQAYFDLVGRANVDFEAKSQEEFWIETNTGSLHYNKYLTDSKTIYNFKVTDESIQAIGIGEDGTGEGSVARLSSLDVARFYTSEI